MQVAHWQHHGQQQQQDAGGNGGRADSGLRPYLHAALKCCQDKSRERLTPVAIIARVLSGDLGSTISNVLDVNGIADDVRLDEIYQLVPVRDL